MTINHVRSPKLLALARGQLCVVCRADDGTVVAAHSNLLEHGKGMGIKAHDCMSAWLCARCHAEYDQGKSMTKEEKREFILSAICKTIIKLWQDEYIRLK